MRPPSDNVFEGLPVNTNRAMLANPKYYKYYCAARAAIAYPSSVSPKPGSLPYKTPSGLSTSPWRIT